MSLDELFDERLKRRRAFVQRRDGLLASRLPAGVVPTLGPDATGVGHVFWYTVEGEGRSLRELRSIQDWFVRYQLNAVPGVAEVASIGGSVQQYQIDVDPVRLRSFGIPLSAVIGAVRDSNRNVGGNVLESNGAWAVVRGVPGWYARPKAVFFWLSGVQIRLTVWGARGNCVRRTIAAKDSEKSGGVPARWDEAAERV
jgi:Cu(I)/Ag(I) efflux system membrane protein CusA/SilA